MSALLKEVGYDAQHAFSGREALAMLDRFSPHFFLLDIGMPNMDGYELARQLRKRNGANATLIAISGYGQHEDQERARLAGFNEHLTKPVSTIEIQRILKKYVKEIGVGNA